MATPPHDPDAPPDAKTDAGATEAADDASTDTAAAAPGQPGRLAELRARDLTRPAEELRAALSPAEIEQLAAWFGVGPLAEAEAPAQPPMQHDYFGRVIDPEERKRRTEVRDRAMEAVDPRMIGLLDRHTSVGDRMLSFRAQLEVNLDTRGFERDHLRFAAREITEVEIPEDVNEAMKHAVPQALLRDLHRLDEEYTIEYERPNSEDTDLDPLAAAKAAITDRYQFEAPPTIGLAAAREGLRDLRDAKAQDWSAIRTPRRRVED